MKKRMPPERNTRQHQNLKGIKFRPKWAESGKKPLAPYGHRIIEKSTLYPNLNIHIFACQNRWERAQTRNQVNGPSCGLVLPAGSVPEQFRWPVERCGLFIVMDEHNTRQDAEHFGRVLHGYGADLIVLSYGLQIKPSLLFVKDAAWRRNK